MRRGPAREYRELMRRYRSMRTRPEVGLELRPAGRGGQRSTLRQPDVDEVLGSGAGVYQKVESGRLRPSPELLTRITEVLRFSRHDARVAHLDAFSSDPVLPPVEPSPHWRLVVDGQQEMMCALAPDGRLIAHNAAFAEMFDGGVPPRNLWRWALFSPEARDVVLANWEKDWAPFLVAECRLLRYQYPSEPAVRRLYADLADDARLRDVPWADSGLNERLGSLRHARKGDGQMRVMVAEAASVRLLTLLFEGA